MRLLAPAAKAKIADKEPKFAWVEAEHRDYYDVEDRDLKKLLVRVSGRASMALTLAMGEWICQRFSLLNKDPQPIQYLEAGWAEQMKPGRGSYIETDDDEWRGNVRGPLSIVITIANDALFCAEEDPDIWVRAVWMSNFAHHLLPRRDAFDAWVREVIERLAEHHPKKGSAKESPEGDDFELGGAVPRELFDTTKKYARADEKKLIQKFLKSLDPKNPFLSEDDKEDKEEDDANESQKPEKIVASKLSKPFKPGARTPPPYILNSGVLDAPAKFPWNGEGMHFGPSQGTKLHKALGKLTTRGISSVAVLTLEWLLWRFHTVIDHERYLHYVDSVFAWQIDLRYRNERSLKFANDTRANQATGDAVWSLHGVTSDRYWEYPEVNVHTTASLISIVKQVLPPKAKNAFLKWLDVVVKRAAKLDPHPKKKRPQFLDYGERRRDEFKIALRPHFGNPLPRKRWILSRDTNRSSATRSSRNFSRASTTRKIHF